MLTHTIVVDNHICLEVYLSILFGAWLDSTPTLSFKFKCGQEASFDLVNYEENYRNYEETQQMSLPRRGFKCL